MLSKQGGLGLEENRKPIAARWGSAPLQETAASLSPTRHGSNQPNATQKLASAKRQGRPVLALPCSKRKRSARQGQQVWRHARPIRLRQGCANAADLQEAASPEQAACVGPPFSVSKGGKLGVGKSPSSLNGKRHCG
jgi:hypothetical protein